MCVCVYVWMEHSAGLGKVAHHLEDGCEWVYIVRVDDRGVSGWKSEWKDGGVRGKVGSEEG